METLRIGIVGCGRILPAHFRGFRRLREAGIDDFRVTALVARNPDDAARFRKRGEGPAPRPPVSRNPGDALAAPHSYVSDFQPEEEATIYESVEAMLAADAVDAVAITATLSVHHTVGVACLQAGKHLLVEKPLAITVRAAKLLVDEAERQDRKIAVAETVRYLPENRLAHWMIERGRIGDPQMVMAVSIGTPEWSPDWIVADTPWRHDKLQAGGGTAIDIGVHLVHRLRYLVGEIDRVSAVARTFEPLRYRRGERHREVIHPDVDDAFFALPEFRNGATGTISFSWAGHGDPTGLPEGLAIYGSRGCLKDTLLIDDHGHREEASEIFEREADASLRRRLRPAGLLDPFALAYYDWFQAIRSGGQPEASGVEALRDLATAYAILESAEAGRAVAVDDVLSGTVDRYQRPIDEYYGLVG
ncbi:MAG TPA: Gfo/Idh/MocA family oxidoreductase [Thermomicrobiaceae bacterium]|nr:Gfo/Idh/MocA family oxidoreductase [Thermomicrobiaceae bacterium]